jgi:hypothetical protein
MSIYDGYTPTEDDIRAYNEDQARAEAQAEAQAELDNQQQLTDQPSARQHTWTEDGAAFTVENVCGNVCLDGERFRGGTITSNEAVLARELLRVASNRDLQLRRLGHDYDLINSQELEIVQLTNRVNALTARIEEALDLLIHETDSSRRVEQAYRMLEKVMMDNVNVDNLKGETK